MTYRILIFALILTIQSCTDNRQRRKDIVSEKIAMINGNRKEWNKLTEDILNDDYVNQNIGKFINPLNLRKDIQERLEKNGIVHISVQKSDSCSEVEYLTDWTKYPVGALYLNKNTCDSVQTKEGYYLDNFNDNFIEVWGIGNEWLIWTDSDFI